MLAPNAYSYREEFVPVIRKTVQSQVHEVTILYHSVRKFKCKCIMLYSDLIRGILSCSLKLLLVQIYLKGYLDKVGC